MIIANEDVKQVTAEIPAGHHHLRTTIILRDGRELETDRPVKTKIGKKFFLIAVNEG
jgi:hypothetical protein